MDMAGSIDLHNSLQKFSIKIVWQLRTVKVILVLNTTQVKKNVVDLQKKQYRNNKKQKTNIDIMYNYNCLKNLLLTVKLLMNALAKKS